MSGPGRRGGLLATIGYVLVLAFCSVLSLAGLGIGAVVAAAARFPGGRRRAGRRGVGRQPLGRGRCWPRCRPANRSSQLVLDYGFSLVSVSLAVALLTLRERSWSIRLFALAVIGSAGAFNLQAYAAATAVESASGLAIGPLHQVLLPGVACAAYILALTVFPTAGEPDRAGLARTALVAVGGGTLLLVGSGIALLPQATSCVLFFGFLVPLAGLTALPGNIRHAQLAVVRTQSRLLFSVLAGAFAVTLVLTVVTGVLWWAGWTGLVLVDPTARTPGSGGLPIALLFWFSRLACIAIAGAVLVATRRGGSWTAEHLFSRGLVAALVGAMIAGGHIVLRTLIGPAIDQSTTGGELALAAVSTVPVALLFLPLYVRAERVVDRLLYGTRPTPYSVLAEIAALSRGTSTDAPDLAQVAEAVGRGLGATACRLTVLRPGLRDRVYDWAAPGMGGRAGRRGPGAARRRAGRHDRGGPGRGGRAARAAPAPAGGRRRQPRRGVPGQPLGHRAGTPAAGRAGLRRRDRGVAAGRGRRDGLGTAAHRAGPARRGAAPPGVAAARAGPGRAPGVDGPAGPGPVPADPDRRPDRGGRGDPGRDGEGGVLAAAGRAGPGPGAAPGAGRRSAAGPGGRGGGGRGAADPGRRAGRGVLLLPGGGEQRPQARPRRGHRGAPGDRGGPAAVHRPRRGAGLGHHRQNASPGRGVRNVAARVAAVGGRVEIRSEPGAGTTVEGSAPLRAPESEPAEAADAGPGFRPGRRRR